MSLSSKNVGNGDMGEFFLNFDNLSMDERLNFLKKSSEMQAEQISKLITALNQLPKSIALEISKLMTEENISRIVNIGIEQVKKQTMENARDTLWYLFKNAVSGFLKVLGALSLAYLAGAFPLFAKFFNWLIKLIT